MADKPARKHKFIKAAVGDNKGKFKAKAEAAGESTAAYAAEKSGAPGTLGKEARLAKTLIGMHKKHSQPGRNRYSAKQVVKG